ncbi:unnamed protein product, partial [marine sediment metagenome]
MERYGDVKDLIFQGFLTERVFVGEDEIIFKSINDAEYNYLKKFYPRKSESVVDAHIFNLHYLYYSIFSINGINLLPYRDSVTSRGVKILAQLPYEAISKLMKILNRFEKRIKSSTELVEAYTYEHESRKNWRVFKLSNNSFTRMNLVTGMDKIGYNSFQEHWLLF